jgi:GntR family transcriptional repressor for pyruvate dehydrogenase complex
LAIFIGLGIGLGAGFGRGFEMGLCACTTKDLRYHDGIMLRPVGRPRVAHEIVVQLRELILGGTFAVGDKLPPERELAERLGVNRGSLREAIKSLELIGLVRTRQGDGTRVTDFMRTAGIELVSHLLIRGGGTGETGEAPDLPLLGEVLEFRVTFGGECARLAAERATAEGLERLREVMRRNESEDLDAAALLRGDFDFYVELASLAKNRVLLLLLNTIRGAVEIYAPFFAGFNAPAEDIRKHERDLLAAVERHDASGAKEIAQAYLTRGLDQLRGVIATLA